MIVFHCCLMEAQTDQNNKFIKVDESNFETITDDNTNKES